MLPALLRLARGQVLVLTGHRTRAPGIERTGPHPAGLAVRTRDSGNSGAGAKTDRKSTRLNSSHLGISYAVFCLKKVIIDSGNVPELLNRAAEQTKADVLVIGHSPRRSHLGDNGEGYGIIRDFYIPVLSPGFSYLLLNHSFSV